MFLGLIPIVLGVAALVASFVAWERGYRSSGLHKLAVLAGAGLIWLGMVMACLALLTFATPAQAQPRICMPFAEIKAFLRDHHGERPIGGGAGRSWACRACVCVAGRTKLHVAGGGSEDGHGLRARDRYGLGPRRTAGQGNLT